MDRTQRRSVEELETFVPYLIHVAASGLSSGASRVYRKLFGITGAEWHMLLILSTERNITAKRACRIIGLDRSLASRLVRSLGNRGLIRVSKHPDDNRQRAINLTDKGWRLHAKVDEVSKARSRQLLAIFSEREYRQLVDLLQRLNAELPMVNANWLSAKNGKASKVEKAAARIGNA